MSYTKTAWSTGDTITADKLNNIEGGIEANETAVSAIDTSPMIVTYTYDSEADKYTTQTTFGEVLEAFEDGVTVIFVTETEGDGTASHISGLVNSVSWNYSDNEQYPYVGGVDVGDSGGWSVAQPSDSIPQTFETFCACTLYKS